MITVKDFNPHHHAGGDKLIPYLTGNSQNFNPHHHAGGDALWRYCFTCSTHFNPHHHAGGDWTLMFMNVWSYIFQSTPPRRW